MGPIWSIFQCISASLWRLGVKAFINTHYMSFNLEVHWRQKYCHPLWCECITFNGHMLQIWHLCEPLWYWKNIIFRCLWARGLCQYRLLHSPFQPSLVQEIFLLHVAINLPCLRGSRKLTGIDKISWQGIVAIWWGSIYLPDGTWKS